MLSGQKKPTEIPIQVNVAESLIVVYKAQLVTGTA